MSEHYTIETAGIGATVAADGAELVSLKDAAGAELLWQAGPEWPRHAPVLFPIVGRLAGDTLHHAGKDYTMNQHGLARDSAFALVEQGPDRLVFRLTDSAASRSHYPFAFVLDMIYVASGASLSVTARVSNPGETILPCGIGAHPGFRWPLVDGIAKEAHVLEFATEETGVALSVEGGLLGAPKPLPFDGRVLPLAEAIFARDALVMPDVVSRSVRFSARSPEGETVRSITVDWEGYRDLGIWSKPTGAPFLCIEPWLSMASPVGWDGDFADKPGLMHLAPGESRDLVWRVTI
ncbi:aldose 1-epimerase [Aureimonas sp. SA4125]|uniref:aldose 1-epimerase family protein n=1 Tax=Aureimonas sp. SA4125 TaxID=2826993 RepID=UPI001CC45B80|nr:aldose 1-epimerase family protein [Aureimonas sp. SA4125]BDA82716.1 aldose 1-epimerase [Aureimonas sp. SA4125]